MKRFLSILLLILLLLIGLFLWKGGHHALHLYSELTEWTAEDASDQSFRLMLDGTALEGESFWIDRSGRRVYGLVIADQTLYLRENVLYTDSGKAYTLPTLEVELGDFILSAFLQGRISKEGDIRTFSTELEQLKLDVSASDGGRIDLDVEFLLEGVTHDLSLSVLRGDTKSHTIPQNVVDAMVRADMEPPISILEPLEAVGPALSALTALEADVAIQVECGIINISDQLELCAGEEGFILRREGVEIQLPIPSAVENVQPLQLGFLFLRHGEFEKTADGAKLGLQIPGDSIGEILESAIPELSGLGVSYQDAVLELTVSGDHLRSANMEVGGSVPFLITEIPITIALDCTIK